MPPNDIQVHTFTEPRRVVLVDTSRTRFGHNFPLAPLEALHLAGQLFAAALELLGDLELGVPQKEGAAVVLWESFGGGEGGSWNPSFLSSVPAVQKEVARLRESGAPYMVTVLIFNDPLNLPAPEPNTDE